jgi:hypothetical protein
MIVAIGARTAVMTAVMTGAIGATGTELRLH